MKKQSITHVAKVLLVLGASLGFLANGSNESRASEVRPDSTAPVQIKYEGSNENLLTFSVSYLNPEGKSFTLEIRNEQSEVLFRHAYTSKNFSKKIYLLKSHEQALVSFGIRTGKNEIKESFSIRPETKVIEDLIVKRL